LRPSLHTTLLLSTAASVDAITTYYSSSVYCCFCWCHHYTLSFCIYYCFCWCHRCTLFFCLLLLLLMPPLYTLLLSTAASVDATTTYSSSVFCCFCWCHRYILFFCLLLLSSSCSQSTPARANKSHFSSHSKRQ
jgi:hypothetical protein